MQSIAERVELAGFTLRRVEGSIIVNGHLWKVLTIPSRRRWPVCGTVVDALRMVSLGALSYSSLERLDRWLFRLGFGARQALVVAERRAHGPVSGTRTEGGVEGDGSPSADVIAFPA